MKKMYEIEVDCAACAQKIEDAIKKLDDIIDASVNYMTQKLYIEANDDIDIDKLMKKVIKISRKIEPDCEIKL